MKRALIIGGTAAALAGTACTPPPNRPAPQYAETIACDPAATAANSRSQCMVWTRGNGEVVYGPVYTWEVERDHDPGLTPRTR